MTPRWLPGVLLAAALAFVAALIVWGGRRDVAPLYAPAGAVSGPALQVGQFAQLHTVQAQLWACQLVAVGLSPGDVRVLLLAGGLRGVTFPPITVDLLIEGATSGSACARW